MARILKQELDEIEAEPVTLTLHCPKQSTTAIQQAISALNERQERRSNFLFHHVPESNRSIDDSVFVKEALKKLSVDFHKSVAYFGRIGSYDPGIKSADNRQNEGLVPGFEDPSG